MQVNLHTGENKVIVTFCGHANFKGTKELENKILSILESLIGDNAAAFYLGGYGEFDIFAYYCCVKYKETHPKVSIVFVTPYLSLEYQKNHLSCKKEKYDYIVYAETEAIPPKFAIIYRNKYMIEKANFVIAYVNHNWGGAYKTLLYAKRKGKVIFNLAEELN